jgi:hypothetical protein
MPFPKISRSSAITLVFLPAPDGPSASEEFEKKVGGDGGGEDRIVSLFQLV